MAQGTLLNTPSDTPSSSSSSSSTSTSLTSPYIGKSFYLPLEIKTGKHSAHAVTKARAQVLLYILSLLIRERSCVSTSIRSAFLRNSHHNTMENVGVVKNNAEFPLPCRFGMVLFITGDKVATENICPRYIHAFNFV